MDAGDGGSAVLSPGVGVVERGPHGFKDSTAEVKYDLSAFWSTLAGAMMLGNVVILGNLERLEMPGRSGRADASHTGNARCPPQRSANVYEFGKLRYGRREYQMLLEGICFRGTISL